ncbi:predicted protein [Mycobacterium tuberculosis T17]|nr:predicted protein [Mycobacterium tuberculosis T17]
MFVHRLAASGFVPQRPGRHFGAVGQGGHLEVGEPRGGHGGELAQAFDVQSAGFPRRRARWPALR